MASVLSRSSQAPTIAADFNAPATDSVLRLTCRAKDLIWSFRVVNVVINPPEVSSFQPRSPLQWPWRSSQGRPDINLAYRLPDRGSVSGRLSATSTCYLCRDGACPWEAPA